MRRATNDCRQALAFGKLILKRRELALDNLNLPTERFLGRENGRLAVAHAWGVIGARVQAA